MPSRSNDAATPFLLSAEREIQIEVDLFLNTLFDYLGLGPYPFFKFDVLSKLTSVLAGEGRGNCSGSDCCVSGKRLG